MPNDKKELAVSRPETLSKKKEESITDIVLDKVNVMVASGSLFLPPTYNASNALKSAWLALQEIKDRSGNLALTHCARSSIANALLDMVVQGLSPAKKQCYFVPYGKQLTLMRSYMGTVAVAKRAVGISDVYAHCIYRDDNFEYEIIPETGNVKIIKHSQSFGNIDIEKITGAYAVIVRPGKENYVELMTIDQIRTAWNQGATKGGSGAHKNFTEEMAKKTVINRACKMFVNTGDDSDLLVEAFNRTSEAEFPGIKNGNAEVDADETERIDAVKDLIMEADDVIEVVDIEISTPFDVDAEDSLIVSDEKEGGESDATDQG